ncbi:MAG: fluoride efflux transporter CrcB [Ignavibacteriales bacterium]|nr:fluoride efflux transporter CrcB [Ignavibacteriales bacterium]
MVNIILVFLGGGIGAAARYWLSGVVYQKVSTDFPYGTLTVNAIGCLLIGILMAAMEERFLVQPSLRVFLTIGILGGFTTFSTFSFETIALLRDGEILYALVNIFTSIFVCLFGTWVGMQIGKLL